MRSGFQNLLRGPIVSAMIRKIGMMHSTKRWINKVFFKREKWIIR